MLNINKYYKQLFQWYFRAVAIESYSKNKDAISRLENIIFKRNDIY